MSGTREKIMLVDDNIASLTAGRHLLKPFLEVYPASSAAQMFGMLEKIRPDLILLDVDMPEVDGYETIGILKNDSRFADIPVIFVTAMDDEASKQKGFDLGAADYVSKPFSPELLVERIRRIIQSHVETPIAGIEAAVDVTEETRVIERKNVLP